MRFRSDKALRKRSILGIADDWCSLLEWGVGVGVGGGAKSSASKRYCNSACGQLKRSSRICKSNVN